MGFSQKQISWIIPCVNSVSYHIMLNGKPRDSITPSRGLRQGDPLSPYLFILCTEVLISNLKAAETGGRLTGLKVVQVSPPVFHILFADDSLFFSKATNAQSETVLSILTQYGNACGHQMNFDKLAITFGKEVDLDTQVVIRQQLGISNEGVTRKYLGILEQLHGSKAQIFAYVRDRLNSPVNEWLKIVELMLPLKTLRSCSG